MVGTHRSRRRARAVAFLAVLLLPTEAAAAPAPQQVFVFDGRGHGHGVGLAQDSANAMAAAGADQEQILDHFYPGTSRGSRGGTVRVDVWEGAGASAVDVSLPGGGRVAGDNGSTRAAPGAVLHIAYDATGYHVRQVGGSGAGGVSSRARWPAEPLSGMGAPPSSQLPLPLPTVSRSSQPAPVAAGSPTATPQASAGPSRSATSPGHAPSRSAAASPVPTPVAAASVDSAGPVTISPADGGVTLVRPTGRSYRGDVIALSRQGFRLINSLDVETYLRGLGEMPAGWPLAALRAQAVAARTYALRAASASAPLGYDLCDDTRCQVYLGAQRETARSDEATSSTRGEVITYRGGLADAFYSANAGGRTASPAEGFGSSNTTPYLRGGIPAAGTVAAWTASVAPAAVAARLQYPGRLTGIDVSERGPSGRVTRLTLQGSAGARELTGVDAAQRLGFWSTLFSVRRGTGVAQPLPPARTTLTQLAPEAAAVAPAVALPAAAPTPAPTIEASAAGKSRLLAGSVIATAIALLLGAAALTAYDGVRKRRTVLPD